MTSENFLDLIPLWAFFAITMLLSFLAIEAGLWLGRRRRRAAEPEQDGPVGAVAAATLGLAAFLMAFTFGMTANRFDARKQLLIDEVNAIGTTYLRAGLLSKPHRTETRNLLREYVALRANAVNLMGRPDEFRAAIARSEALLDRLWSHAVSIAEADRSSEIDALFISSLNEMIDLHTERVVVVLQRRIPLVIWGGLFFVSILAMVAVGFQFGLGGRRSHYATLVLVLSFSATLLIIRDMDWVNHGWLKVSQQPMIELQQKLNAPGT